MEYRGINSEAPLYKYIPWKYLKSMLSTKQVLFCKVSTWESSDEFENMFRRLRLYTKDYYVSVHSITELLYGQSWSSKGETKEMWEKHSDITRDGEFSVLVRTTAERIANMVEESILVGQNHIKISGAIIGKVSYFTEEQIDNWFLGLGDIPLEKVNSLHIEYTFKKKDCYSFENEIRCLVRDIDDEHKEMLSFGIEPLSFFDSFVIDYRLDKQTRTQIEKQIESFGIETNKVHSSIFLC